MIILFFLSHNIIVVFLIKEIYLISFQQKTRYNINVHFVISEPLITYCISLSKRINSVISSLFNYKSNCIASPFISSLFMGIIDSQEKLENVFRVTKELSQKLNPFVLAPTNLYYKRKCGKVIIDTLQNDFLAKQKDYLFSNLTAYVSNLDVRNEHPYIAVASCRLLSGKGKELVNNYSYPPSCMISQIAVSKADKNGTNLEIMKTFNLQQDN